MGASCDPHYTQVITSICRQPMDTKLSRDGQFSQLFEEAIEVSMKLCIYCGMVWYGMVYVLWYGMVYVLWYGMVYVLWYGMVYVVWYGMVYVLWYGMVYVLWYGMVYVL